MLPCPSAASRISGTRSPSVRGRLLLLLRAPRPPPPECLATGLTVLAPGPILAQRVLCLARGGPGGRRGPREALEEQPRHFSVAFPGAGDDTDFSLLRSHHCPVHPQAPLVTRSERQKATALSRVTSGARMGAGVGSTAFCRAS